MAKNTQAAAVLALVGGIFGPAKTHKVFATFKESLIPGALMADTSHPNPKKAASLYLTDVLLDASNIVAIRPADAAWGEDEEAAIAEGYSHVVFFTTDAIGEQVKPIDEAITTITGITADDTYFTGGLLVSTADAEGNDYGTYSLSGRAALWLEAMPTASGVETPLEAAEPEPEPEPAKPAKGAKGGKPAAEEAPAPAAKGGKGGKPAAPEAPAPAAKGGKGGKPAAPAEDAVW